MPPSGATPSKTPSAPRYTKAMATPTAKDELRSIIDALTPEEAERLLDVISVLLDDGAVSDEEVEAALAGMEEIRRGESISWGDLRRETGRD